ncbi:MAG: FG-GAP repeat domain-containing protein, partial [Bacteroidia bacterium]
MIKVRRYSFCPALLLLLLLALQGSAQPVFSRYDSIQVYNGASQLKNPWAGGLNFTEWSSVDLDLDGFKDIVVFDKSGEKLRAFRNDGIAGQASYTHAPQFQNAFPTVNSWCVFYDYNNDGKSDIFTYTYGMGSIKVFRNTSTPGNLQFTLARNIIYTTYYSNQPPYNLYCSQVAIPGLADLDNDGDMDILSFSLSGITIEYHKNLSMETYGNADSLVFKWIDSCWGDIDENSCESHMNSTYGCAPYQKYKEITSGYTTEKTNLHAGSCIMCFDADGDKDTDIILGDISCDSLDFMRNGGTFPYAHIDSITKIYPVQHPATLKLFPCSYFLDVNNDSKRDLIVAPNIQGAENYQSAWMYENINQDSFPKFQFIKNNFFQEDMIELGEGAYPAAFDYEGDGDLDLLVGNFGYFNAGPPSTYTSSLALLENTGTTAQPQFTLQSGDFQNISGYNIVNKAPGMGDFDNDGDYDLFIGGYDGKLSYFENTAPVGTAAVFTFVSDYYVGFLQGIDIGVAAYPNVIDLDRDGIKDLIVGEYNGTLNYFRNTGTAASPQLTLIKDTLGNVKVVEQGYSYGQAMTCIFDDGGTYKMAVGSERGYMYMYGNIDGNLNGSFSKIDSIYGGIREGEHVAPCIADFNGDGNPDLVIGNYSGGLAYYKGNPNTVSVQEQQVMLSDLSIFPNPAKDHFMLKFASYNLEKKQIHIC